MELFINDRIRNRKVDFFSDFTLELKMNQVASAFTFKGYFNPNNTEHKEMYCIGHDHVATLKHKDQLLLTGYIMSQKFIETTVDQLAEFSGYSFPGVLEDCNIPPDSWPLQFDGMNLKEIAQRVCAPYSVKVIVSPSVASEMEKNYEKVEAEPTQTVKDFLAELVGQRNVLMSHDAKGNLVFTRANVNQKPVINYGGDGVPCTTVGTAFNGQGMHSHITVVKQANQKEGGNTSQITIRNPYVPFVVRHRVVTQTSGDDVDTESVARAVLAEELRNIAWEVTIDRWDINKRLLMPGEVITLIAPKAYLYKKTKLLIEGISYSGNPESFSATLSCVLPEVYSGATPAYLFKGINLH